jgi:hypothetical protein
VNQTNDSLKTIIHGLEGIIERYQNESAIENMVSAEEMPIRNLVDKVHQGWEALAKEKDVNALLGNFLPYYSAHAVRIDIENIPSVSRSNETDFTDHLVAVTEVDGLSVIFGEPQFFYTEVRGNLFSTCYRVLMKLYIHDELQETKSIVSLVAGEDRDGWKVGSYAWVTFDY